MSRVPPKAQQRYRKSKSPILPHEPILTPVPRLLVLLLVCSSSAACGVLAKAQEPEPVLATEAYTERAVAIEPFRDRPVTTELEAMSLGTYTAYTITVAGADEKTAAKEWRTYVKKFGGKAKRSKPEAGRALGVQIDAIGGANPLDLYADFQGRGSDVKVVVWFSERGSLIGADASERDREAIEDFLREFARSVRRAIVSEELAAEEKALAKVDRELARLARDIERAERDIARARETIERSEAAIERDRAAIVETETARARQSEAVQAVAEKLAAIER